MATKSIDTTQFSTELRARSIDVANKKLLITNFQGTEQEKDLTLPANCQGFGRVRHFHRETSDGWPSNPLPIDPASNSLGTPPANLLQAQVFQNASCNWRCWYCYVPFSLLSANEKHASWLSAADLLDLYLAESTRPVVIDLSGGQPDLVPEWIPWMMRELIDRELDQSVYLWSDDNLSNDYFWHFLSEKDRSLVREYKNYGKVCCFKGFDSESFAFNTSASPDLFPQQFDLFRRYVELDIDVYGYATFTAPTRPTSEKMKQFVDMLQCVHDNLPLRIIPLEVRPFTPISRRLNRDHTESMEHQQIAVSLWQDELARRFSGSLLTENIAIVSLWHDRGFQP